MAQTLLRTCARPVQAGRVARRLCCWRLFFPRSSFAAPAPPIASGHAKGAYFGTVCDRAWKTFFRLGPALPLAGRCLARRAGSRAPYRQAAAPCRRALAAGTNSLSGPFAVEVAAASKALAHLRFAPMLHHIRLLCCRSTFGPGTRHSNSFARPRKLSSARAFANEILQRRIRASGSRSCHRRLQRACGVRSYMASTEGSIRASGKIGQSHRAARGAPDDALRSFTRPGGRRPASRIDFSRTISTLPEYATHMSGVT